MSQRSGLRAGVAVFVISLGAPLWTFAQRLIPYVVILSLGLFFAIGASPAVAENQLRPHPESFGLHAQPTDIGRMPSSSDLNAIAKQCQIAIWRGKDSIILQGVEPKDQKAEYDKKRDCASRLIRRKGFKGATLIG